MQEHIKSSVDGNGINEYKKYPDFLFEGITVERSSTHHEVSTFHVKSCSRRTTQPHTHMYSCTPSIPRTERERILNATGEQTSTSHHLLSFFSSFVEIMCYYFFFFFRKVRLFYNFSTRVTSRSGYVISLLIMGIKLFLELEWKIVIFVCFVKNALLLP